MKRLIIEGKELKELLWDAVERDHNIGGAKIEILSQCMGIVEEVAGIQIVFKWDKEEKSDDV